MIVGFFFIPVNDDLAFSRGDYIMIWQCYVMVFIYSCLGYRYDWGVLLHHLTSSAVGGFCSSLE